GIAAALFLIMAAGQMLATSALVPLTVRTDRNLDFIASQGLLIDDLLGMVLPRTPGQNVYLGMIAVLAAAITLTIRPTARSYTLAGIAAAGLLLSVGPGGTLLSSFSSFVPLAGFFRYAQRYSYVMIIPFAALAVESITHLAAL